MCLACHPSFATALRQLSWPSRRQFLKGAGAVVGGPFIAEAVVRPARADGDVNEQITRGLEGPPAAPPITIYVADKIVTMERGNPSATAVAVAGKRIVAVGTLDEVKAALGDRPSRWTRRSSPRSSCRASSISTSTRSSARSPLPWR